MVNQDSASALEIFFEEEAWLRRLARKLVQDDAAAQDLVQETWLAALQNPPKDLSRPRAWLSAVAKRLASKQRSKLKPSLGEPLDGRVSEFERPCWAAVRFETGTRLRRAVEELEEPHKTTVLLRFQERLPQAAIAERMDVTERSVRNRIQAALDQIRLDLGQSVEGDELEGRSWAVMIAPLLRYGDLAGPGPVGTGTPGSANLQQLGLIGLGVLLTASVGWVVIDGMGGDVVARTRGGPDDALSPGALSRAELIGGEDSDVRVGRSSSVPLAAGGTDAAHDDEPDPDDEVAEAVAELTVAESSALFVISGSLLIDGEVPPNISVSAIPLPFRLNLPEASVTGLDEEGLFSVELLVEGKHHLELFERPDPGRGRVAREVGQPRIVLEREATQSEQDREIHIAYSSGGLVLLGVPPDGQHSDFTLNYVQADWSYTSHTQDGDLDGRAEFVLVPEGTVTLVEGTVLEGTLSRELEIHAGEILTFDLRSGEKSYLAR